MKFNNNLFLLVIMMCSFSYAANKKQTTTAKPVATKSVTVRPVTTQSVVSPKASGSPVAKTVRPQAAKVTQRPQEHVASKHAAPEPERHEAVKKEPEKKKKTELQFTTNKQAEARETLTEAIRKMTPEAKKRFKERMDKTFNDIKILSKQLSKQKTHLPHAKPVDELQRKGHIDRIKKRFDDIKKLAD